MHRLYTPALLLILLATWIVGVYHMAVMAPPPLGRQIARPEFVRQSKFQSRSEFGLNHLVVVGNAYERGLATGQLTSNLMVREEEDLVQELNHFFPKPVARWGLLLVAMRWFSGIEDFLEPRHTDEMFGVAQSAPHEFDYLTDAFTRQVAYHGVHEVGQMFVDFDRQDFGCTLIGVPRPTGWLLGRNFDFEAVRILDTEKILKWAFPDDRHAYLAVTWAGMVGVVTGVNDHGVYVSINAAGSSDFRRYGTPTTLVALKVLEEADTPEEAVRIIEQSPTFITDLFVVAGPDGRAPFVVEKTPKRFETMRQAGAFAVTNHLRSPSFAADRINAFRMREQTSVARLARATELGTSLAADPRVQGPAAASAMVEALRDKHGVGDAPLHLGHRSSLDPLIATHSVVYDAVLGQFWVSQGPALSGPYLGYDLKQSFATRTPVPVGTVPPDPLVDSATFQNYKEAMIDLRQARQDLSHHLCDVAHGGLARIGESPAREHYEFLMALADYHEQCLKDAVSAKTYRQAALDKKPAYLRHQTALQKAVQ